MEDGTNFTAQNNAEKMTFIIDLNYLYVVTDLKIKFPFDKQPEEFSIEMSQDTGKTWTTNRFYSNDCKKK